jgi:hypothetical protein
LIESEIRIRNLTHNHGRESVVLPGIRRQDLANGGGARLVLRLADLYRSKMTPPEYIRGLQANSRAQTQGVVQFDASVCHGMSATIKKPSPALVPFVVHGFRF